MESFWGTLKCEMDYLSKFYNIEELKKAIEEYIGSYNEIRFQAKLKGSTPIQFRNQALVN